MQWPFLPVPASDLGFCCWLHCVHSVFCRSTLDEFNPKPASQKHLSHSLVDLLNQASFPLVIFPAWSIQAISDTLLPNLRSAQHSSGTLPFCWRKERWSTHLSAWPRPTRSSAGWPLPRSTPLMPFVPKMVRLLPFAPPLFFPQLHWLVNLFSFLLSSGVWGTHSWSDQRLEWGAANNSRAATETPSRKTHQGACHLQGVTLCTFEIAVFFSISFANSF